MTHANQEIMSRFFDIYGRRDLVSLPQVLAADVRWVFPGRNPFSGTHTGIDGVVAFFDRMGGVMGSSDIKFAHLLESANDTYAVQVQHIQTQRSDGNNLDHQWCVLWTFADGKITEGRHFAADQHAVDAFFNRVASTGK
jgi:ketosteroid isomerase-like protein